MCLLLPAQQRHLPVSLHLAYVENKYHLNVCSTVCVIITKKLDHICVFTLCILIYFSYISSKHLNLLWCYFDLGSLMLMVIVIVCTAAKKQKEFYVLLTVHPCIISQISPTRCTILFDIFIYLFLFSTCFGHPRAHHQEKNAVSMRHWYLTLCMRGDWSAQTRRNPYRVTKTSVA